MALNHTINDNSEQKRQIFTFYVNDMMFGLKVENVLMVGQDLQNIQKLPVEERGFCGVTKFQGVVVPVLDFAHRIDIPSGFDSKAKLLTTLAQREKDHEEWIDALANSIKTGVKFTKAKNPDECEFGIWYKNFKTWDETLKELLTAFEEPHLAIHALANELLLLTESGKQAEALDILERARHTTLQRLLAVFARVKEQIKSSMRQVLLFVTDDGRSPRYALMLDDVNDVINYSASDFQPSNNGPLSIMPIIEAVIDGVYTKNNQQDCLFFNTDKISDIDALMAKGN